MKRITLLLMSVLLYATSAWAQIISVTIVDGTGTNAPFDTYGTRNNSATPNTLTTNKASGLEGVVLSAPVIDRATWWNTYCLALRPSATQTAETVTITAPKGYLLKKVDMTAQANSSTYPYDVVFNGSTTNVTGASAKTFSNDNIFAPSFSFTIKHTAASFDATNKWLAVKSMTLELVKIVTRTSDISPNKSYMVKCDRSAWAVANDGTALSTIGSLDLALSIPDAKQRFAFVTPKGGTDYYLYSVNAGKFLHAESNAGDGGSWVYGPNADKVYFEDASSYKANTWRLYLEGGNKNINVNGYEELLIDSWATADAGCAYYLIEAADVDGAALVERLKGPISVTWNVVSEGNGKTVATGTSHVYRTETLTLPSSLTRSFCDYEYFADAACTKSLTSFASDYSGSGNETIYAKYTFSAPFTVSTSFSDATWYYATIRGSKYLRADDNAKDSNGRYSTNSSNGLTDVYKWAFFGNPYALYIANKGQGEGMYLNAGSAVPNFVKTTTPATTTATLWEAIANDNGFNLRSLTGTNLYINDDGNGGNLGYWNDTKGRTDDGGKWVVTKEFDALIVQLEAMSFGTGVNQYLLVVESIDYTSQAAGIISGIKAQGFTADNLATAQLLLASATLNLPSAGFYRIKGKTSGNYLAAGMANSKYAMSSATDATTIFYYDGTKVVNFGSGMANGMSQSSWDWKTGDAASTVTFADGGTNGGYSFKSSDAFFYDGGTYADRGSSLGDDARYRSWYLTEVNTLPVTIYAAGYATFNSPVAVKIPQDITAYQASVQDADYIRLVSIDDGVIPANFPVVLKGNPGTYTFNITTTELTGENYHANELKGSIAAMSVSGGEIYTLQRDSETSVGFYPNAGTTFKGFSAYLRFPSGSRGFQMVSSTGIEHIATPILFENAYDLQGRKAGIVKKGVYIVNGKKVLF